MPPIWKPQPNEVLQKWVDDVITEASDDLNEWETNFINDMKIRIDNRWELTRTQQDRLEQIYADKTH